jgi:SAM-dependent methyltransferase
VQSTEIERLAHFEDFYWWHRARQTIVARLLDRYLDSKPSRVLDVGCGAGATSVVASGGGRLLGVDLGADAVAAARARGIEVAQMDATALGTRDGAFDLVAALDVLEHLDDDLGAAREILRSLRPGGSFIATVPAYQWLWSSHDVALGHRRRYTSGRLRKVLEDAGFEVVLCSYVMTSVLPPAAAVRLLEHLPGRRPPAEAAESGYIALPRWLNSTLSWVVGLDGYLAGRIPLPGGLSVAAIGRRPESSSSPSQ